MRNRDTIFLTIISVKSPKRGRTNKMLDVHTYTCRVTIRKSSILKRKRVNTRMSKEKKYLHKDVTEICRNHSNFHF